MYGTDQDTYQVPRTNNPVLQNLYFPSFINKLYNNCKQTTEYIYEKKKNRKK